MNKVKLLKEELNEKLIKTFGNLNQEVLFTYYKFNNIKEVIDYFKIELVLEESHVWTKEDEETLKDYLNSKPNPLEIEEGVWFSTIKVNSAEE